MASKALPAVCAGTLFFYSSGSVAILEISFYFAM
jgi:hypothetical protein